MRALVQRVREASVRVEDQLVGAIDQGLCVFVGVTHDDGPEECDILVNKLLHLRIMDDENGVMNKSVIDKEGEILIVSQFTLYAISLKDADRHGRRQQHRNKLSH